MLSFHVFVATHPRLSPRSENVQTCGHSDVQTSFTPNSLPRHTSENSPVSSLAATLMDLPASVANKRLTTRLSPLDATLTKNRGVTLQVKYFSLSFRIPTFGPSDQRMLQRVSESSPLFSSSYRLTCTTDAAQLFWNQSLVDTFHRDGGCTPSETRVLDWRWNIRPGRNCQPQTVDCQLFRRGEMGTGARGAPVPKVGL